MNILIAPDSFKDALSALEVCKAIEKGILRANPNHSTTLFPLADGGEGTASIFQYHGHGSFETVKVSDPLFRKINASYLLTDDKKTAFIEMSAAAGLQLLKKEERNPLLTSTIGVGELILESLKNKDLEKIILGIGGSATNDVGIGMAAALGYKFLNKKGETIPPIGENLIQIQNIDDSKLKFNPHKLKVEVICDVNNPLYGKTGASKIYAQQKGASVSDIERLETGVIHFSKILEQHFNKTISNIDGTGAAGGMGAGATAFLGAKLLPGIETVLSFTEMGKIVPNYDLIITGEGKIDAQTAHGKLINGICNLVKKYNVPVIAFCGNLSLNAKQTVDLGLQAAFSINPKPQDLSQALIYTKSNLEKLAFNVVKLLDL